MTDVSLLWHAWQPVLQGVCLKAPTSPWVSLFAGSVPEGLGYVVMPQASPHEPCSCSSCL